ncbi:MAG: hypothetical protein AAGK24_01280, partial [Planctomycetota bacterium]
MSDPTSIELPTGSLKERCERFGIPWLDEAPELDLELASRISPDTAVRLRIVPYAVKDGWARAIMADPMDLSAADEASASLGLPVQREGIDTER